MEKLICKHNQEGICHHAFSVMRGKECPVAEIHGVCKDETLVAKEIVQTPLSCMIAACQAVIPTITRDKASQILSEFVANMRANGYVRLPDVDEKQNDATYNGKYNVGDRVSYDEISDSEEWRFDSMFSHTGYPTVTYVTLDNTLTVSFENGSEYGTILLNR
jgi:hypothetical protein